MLAALFLATLRNQVGLEKYVGHDLTKLSYEEVEAFDKRLNKLTDDYLKVFEGYDAPRPEWVREHKTGRIRWLAMLVHRSYTIPGICFFEAFAFDKDWKLVRNSGASTGYRLYIFETRVEPVEGFSLPLFRIRLTYGGGTPSKEQVLSNPKSVTDQWYSFDEQGTHLVRLAQGDGKLLQGHFRWAFPSIGPDTMGRSVAKWRADLASSDPARQIDCMQWLAGSHLRPGDKREKDSSQESVADSMAYESLRADSAIKLRLRELASSSVPWVREQATFTLAEIAKPLPPVENRQ